MNSLETSQTRCRIGIARADITPPIGIYNRMWGAALQDRATAIHRPLLATALWLEPLDDDATKAQLILAVDQCILDGRETARIRQAAAAAVAIDPSQIHVCMSHTHGSGYLCRSRAALPGGDMIGPQLDSLAQKCAVLAQTAADNATAGALVYGTGCCSLAAHRDYWDEDQQSYVCGYNPAGPTDRTLLVARMTDERGNVLGTLVNYACHPTTLAWDNSAISPDFIGAMREVVERETKAPCVFVQGAAGDLGPREGFVGDWQVADRNGRQLGFSALAALEAVPPPGTRFVYSGSTISATKLGTWSHQAVGQEELLRHGQFLSRHFIVRLPYRRDLPNIEETEEQISRYTEVERRASQLGDGEELRAVRAEVERMVRQHDRLSSLPAGDAFPFNVNLLSLGTAVWVFVPGEPYHDFQVALRRRFKNTALVVVTLVDDWHPGYVPAASSYGLGIYQATISALKPGTLETLIDTVSGEIEQLLARSSADMALAAPRG